MDPGRQEWKAWCSLRDGAAKQWCPDSLKPVAFVVNKVSSPASSCMQSVVTSGVWQGWQG